jgi:hypothetical protein
VTRSWCDRRAAVIAEHADLFVFVDHRPTRKRVIMVPTVLGGVRFSAGVILNTPPVRRAVALREARQDARLEREIERLELMERGLVGDQ